RILSWHGRGIIQRFAGGNLFRHIAVGQYLLNGTAARSETGKSNRSAHDPQEAASRHLIVKFSGIFRKFALDELFILIVSGKFAQAFPVIWTCHFFAHSLTIALILVR